ncbi:hypothetical protein [Amycolatopsis sp. lyj-109]|uniref:hypothetical protein n=1 Tax=Amycolatopsis sp. lyj-109 TaxID=2789287 RepID=UPI00397B4DDF
MGLEQARLVGAVEALSSTTKRTKRIFELARSLSVASKVELPVQPRLRTARQLRPEDIDELVRMFKDGASIPDLAAKYRVYRTTIGQHLRARGIDTQHFAFKPEDVRTAGRLYDAGWTLDQLADRYQVGNETVRARLVESGVRMRARGRQRS